MPLAPSLHSAKPDLLFQPGKLVKTAPKKKIWKSQQPVIPDGKMDIAIMSSKMSGRNVGGPKAGAKKSGKVKKVEAEIVAAPEVVPETETKEEEPEATEDKVNTGSEEHTSEQATITWASEGISSGGELLWI